ncbi:MAG: protein kinase [Planctomycetes bacterium]|nr:protein kinase [Planctomycetota bacterium]
MAQSYGHRVPAPLLGELCLQQRLLPPRAFKECQRHQILLSRQGGRKRLGELLVEENLLQPAGLQALLEQQRALGLFAYPEIPGFHLEERLGRGAMAQVYRATQLNVGRAVAFKILNWKEARSRNDLARFYREARSAARLNHPNIVQAIEFGQIEDIYYFVMELVQGVTLQELLVLDGRMDEAASLRIVREVAAALSHLEAHQMVHRDLKPSNILLAGDQVKICDLGLAREFSQQASDWTVTHDGMILGTPQYLSPEQARGVKDLDIRSDLYALGVILYRMITGDLPFRADSPAAFIYKQIHEPIRPPEELLPTVQAETSRLIRTLLAKERFQRHRSAQEALQDIEACLEKAASAPGEALPHAGPGPSPAAARKTAGTTPAATPSDQAALLWTSGREVGRRIPITREVTIVGRQPDCDVQVSEPWFSRRHFSIRREGEQWVFEDLQSRNGSQVNGSAASRCILRNQDEISVRDTSIRFVLVHSP